MWEHPGCPDSSNFFGADVAASPCAPGPRETPRCFANLGVSAGAAMAGFYECFRSCFGG